MSKLDIEFHQLNQSQRARFLYLGRLELGLQAFKAASQYFSSLRARKTIEISYSKDATSIPLRSKMLCIIGNCEKVKRNYH